MGPVGANTIVIIKKSRFSGIFHKKNETQFHTNGTVIHQTAEYGKHQMLFRKYRSTLKKSLCFMALLKVSFLVIFIFVFEDL